MRRIGSPQIEAGGTKSNMENIVLSWSGGKDSVMALLAIKQRARYNVVALGIPLDSIGLPENCTNEEYEAKMHAAMLAYKARGIGTVAFGDLFLEGIRRYHEENLSKVGMNAIFPLWGRDTKCLLQEFLDTGHRAIITCVDTKALDKRFASREKVLKRDQFYYCDLI